MLTTIRAFPESFKSGAKTLLPIMDSSMSFAFTTPSEPWQGSARRYSVRQWEERKTIIQRLYVKENRTTKDIVNILKEAGFVVTWVCHRLMS
jgi:hypothetical protein